MCENRSSWQTLGRYWTAELGSPDDPDMLPTIYATSPLHNVNIDPAVVYPAVLVTTGDHDTRVIPGHSLKYLAELQCECRVLLCSCSKR